MQQWDDLNYMHLKTDNKSYFANGQNDEREKNSECESEVGKNMKFLT